MTIQQSYYQSMENRINNITSIEDVIRFRRLYVSEHNFLRVKYLNSLREVIATRVDIPKNKLGTPLVTDYDLLDATIEEHKEAFRKTFVRKKD